jgi:hypothetical protein
MINLGYFNMQHCRLIFLVFLLLAGGCAIKPPPERICEFRRFAVEPRDVGGAGEAVVAGNAPLLEDVLAKALNAQQVGVGAFAAQPPVSLLYLSGGSQNGAFGAGLLYQWQANRGGTGVPFTLITGISTGALQSSFALIGRPDLIVRGYNITEERDVLTPFLRGGKDKLQTLGGAVTVLRKGAVADLAPLRDRLRQILGGAEGFPDVLEAVAKRVIEIKGTDPERVVLLAGVVDVAHGRAEALDLGEMAIKYLAAKQAGKPAEAERLRDCYIEAVAASSSEPMAALPVFINNRMYVDGGMRIGAFDRSMLRALEIARPAGTAPTAPPASAYLIINGTQEIDSECRKADKTQCDPPGTDARASQKGAHEDWRLTNVGLRSVGILVNSVYQLSAALIERNAQDKAFNALRIDAQASRTHVYNGRSCAEWRAADKARENPLQFHAEQMRCLIHYGQTVACATPWTGGTGETCTFAPMPATLATKRPS